jgi:hypothetical protein
MADMNSIVKVAIDAYRGNVEQYSVGQSMELMHKALVEANGGSTILNYKNIRDGKCNGLFALIEEILSRTVVEGLQGDEYFNALVDFRNLPLGDKNLFLVEDSDMFVVADTAEGTQGIRRQRLGGVSETSIPTTLKLVKIYEELNRVLAGRVDFNYFINKVAEAFRSKLLNDIYTLWGNATADDFGGITFFPTAGAFDEDELLELIAHVEAAANGMKAVVIGTKKAVRNLAPSILAQGTDSQRDMYNMGYFGQFYGTSVVVTPQRHKVGSTEFVMSDDILTILAGDDKPIKCVYEGNPIVLMGDPTSNGDLTQEYLYGERYGMGIVLAGGNAGIGRYEIA